MPDSTALQRLLAERQREASRTLAAEGARADPSLSAQVTRRRGLRYAWRGAASAAVIALVASGGLAWASSLPREATAAGAPTPTPRLTTATLDLDLPFRDAAAVPPSLPACGERVPSPSGDAAGFSHAVADTPGLTLTRRSDGWPALSHEVTATLEYRGKIGSPVLVDDVVWVLARDGMVVSTTWPDPAEWLDRAQGTVVTSSLTDSELGVHWGCLSDAAGVTYPAGDYELYSLRRIHVSEEDVALRELTSRGLSLTAPTGGSYFRPGSIDCERTLASGDATFRPVGCEPTALAGGEVDVDAGTVTVPYDEADFRGALDVTLVSEPIPVTVPEDIPPPDYYRGVDDAVVPATISLFQCGGDVRYLGPALGTWTRIDAEIETGLFADLTRETIVPVSVDVPGAGSSATITWGADARVWLATEEFNGGDTTLVGSAPARWADGGAVRIDRGVARGEALLELPAIEWCGEPPALGGLRAAFIVGDTVVEGDPGSAAVQVVPVYRSDPSWPIGQGEY